MLDTRFTWPVAQPGYRWTDTTELPGGRAGVLPRKGRFLMWKWTKREPPPARIYQPFMETGLFRIFAGLQATEASILEFANQYGMLGGAAVAAVAQPLEGKPGSFQLVSGERLRYWEGEIRAMRDLVKLDQKARAGDKETLDWLMKRAAPDAQEMTPPPMARVQARINNKLLEHRAAALLAWTQERKGSGPGTVPRLRMRIWPTSLIAALWIQFASAIDGEREYRQCEVCPKWFEVTGGRREDAKYCGQACRFRAYRERQKEAKRLDQQGMTLSQIAKALLSDVKTVKGWISK